MSRALSELRVALVHDWLVTLRGGERVLDALCELFPDAVVHTLVRKPGIGTPRDWPSRDIVVTPALSRMGPPIQ